MKFQNKRKRQKRLLFIAHSFPPNRGIAGVRLGCIAKYLARLDWRVTVMALHPHDHPRQGEELRDTRAIKSEWREAGVELIWVQQAPFLTRPANNLWRRVRARWEWEKAKVCGARCLAPWARRVLACSKHINFSKVDVILASGDPFEQFALARQLGNEHNRPYVFDYRDLWLDGLGWSNSGRVSERIIGWQRDLLANVSAVSVVSPSMAEFMEKRFRLGARLHVISNGYDPSDLDGIEPRTFGHFGMVYAGHFYPPKISANPLMQALRRLAEIEPQRLWRFHYYGPNGAHVLESATSYGVEKRVELHGVVSRRECLAAIRGAGVAAIVVSVQDTGDLSDHGIITGKIFEPIGLGTPILVIASRGADVETLVQTVGNGAVFTGSNVEGMAMFFADLMRGKGVESRRPETYSWPALIRRFDEMLSQAIANHRSLI
jgi:glycosyltransferase involved in cell wall biosynthesis